MRNRKVFQFHNELGETHVYTHRSTWRGTAHPGEGHKLLHKFSMPPFRYGHSGAALLMGAFSRSRAG